MLVICADTPDELSAVASAVVSGESDFVTASFCQENKKGKGLDLYAKNEEVMTLKDVYAQFCKCAHTDFS